jgi:DNA-binding SARP family transcriptional activator
VAPMEFCLLGPLMVRRDGVPVRVCPGKQRVLLAELLLNANHVVPADQLAQVLWETGQPQSARASLHNHVMRLRRAVGDADHSRIIREHGGYLISVRAGELDVDRFEASVDAAHEAAGRQSWAEAADLLRTALSLWRGEPLSGVPSETRTLRESPRLAEKRLQALEARIDADLHLGRHADLIAELQQLAVANPLREHLYVLLMLALYRCGRQTEALAAYQQARRALVREAGLEPGAELREMHQRVLAADPRLTEPTGPDRPATAPSPAQARAAHAAAVAASPAPVVPRQLPGAVPYFVGRQGELAALTRALDQAGRLDPGTVVISAVGGMAGVGKTALAVHWAHQVRGRFPDGQLYVNLRGFDRSGTPATPAEAIRGFLDALGVPEDRVPRDLPAQAGLYRGLTAGRRMLIVLDNARDEQQVRPLLPASPDCLVIVTSRTTLTGLAAADGARLLSLDVLSHAEARQLLTARFGTGRAGAEPGTVAEIADLCARLPLALAVAAARASSRPRLPLSILAAELRDAQGRLDVLDTGDPTASVRAIFSWSIRQLTPEAAQLFRLLGLQPGSDITAPAAASLAGVPPTGARQALRELARAHLVAEHAPGRYALHDLLRAYAAEQVSSADSDSDVGCRAATGRLLDHYLHTAHHACLLANPERDAIPLAAPLPGVTPERITDSPAALAWLEAEHRTLVASVMLADQAGFDSHAWQLTWALSEFLDRRGYWHDAAAVHRCAITAADRGGDTAGRAVTYRLASNARRGIGDYDQAYAYLMNALALCRELGDRIGEARTHQHLSIICKDLERLRDARDHSEQALLLLRAAGHRSGEAQALNALGWTHILLGDPQQGQALCRQALALCRELGQRHTESHILDSLGYAEHLLGRHDAAAACYDQAIGLYRELGFRFREAETLTRLGDTLLASSNPRGARRAWVQAVVILQELQDTDADHVCDKLEAGRPDGLAIPAAPRTTG